MANPLGINGRTDPEEAQRRKGTYRSLRRQGVTAEDAKKQALGQHGTASRSSGGGSPKRA